MFCSKCGNQVNDGAIFCCKCGYKLDGSIPVSQNTDNKNNSHQQSPDRILLALIQRKPTKSFLLLFSLL